MWDNLGLNTIPRIPIAPHFPPHSKWNPVCIQTLILSQGETTWNCLSVCKLFIFSCKNLRSFKMPVGYFFLCKENGFYVFRAEVNSPLNILTELDFFHNTSIQISFRIRIKTLQNSKRMKYFSIRSNSRSIHCLKKYVNKPRFKKKVYPDDYCMNFNVNVAFS